MRNFILSISFLFNSLFAFNQSYTGAMTEPIRPSINDSILVIDTIILPEIGNFLKSTNIVINGNNIAITNCYDCSQGFTSLSILYDTTRIGKLAVGTYYCTLYSRKYLSMDSTRQCDSLPNRDTFSFSFTVFKYANGINDVGGERLTISPNPATDKLYISNLPLDATITITDMTGRIFALPRSDHEIDVSSLLTGMYFCEINTGDKKFIGKFIKE